MTVQAPHRSLAALTLGLVLIASGPFLLTARARAGEADGEELVGIGIALRADAEGVHVRRVLPGGPAAKGGLKAGDLIVAIDGAPTAGLSTEEVVKRIAGREGTTVRLTVRDGDAARVLTLTRERFTYEAVFSRLADDGLGLVHIRFFRKGAVPPVVEGLVSQGARGLVVDLRGATGGPLEAVQEALDLFVPAGEVLFRLKPTPGRAKPHRSTTPAATDAPLVVLIDGETRGGAELFAGALKALGRATLVGRPTAGAMRILSPVELADGTEQFAKTADILLPGQDPAQAGAPVEPDVAVPDAASASDWMAAAKAALAGPRTEDARTVSAMAQRFAGMLSKDSATPVADVVAMLADDALQVTSQGTVIAGKPELAAFFRTQVAKSREMVKALDSAYRIEKVRVLGDMAVVFGQLLITGQLGKTPLERTIWETLVFVRRDGRWELWHEHSTLAPLGTPVVEADIDPTAAPAAREEP